MYSMLKRMRQDYNVYVGTETGILKGVNLDHKVTVSKNFHNVKALERGHEITAMAWGNPEQTEILMGLHNQTVRVFDVGAKSFASSRELKVGEGPIVSVEQLNDVTITAVKSGQVAVWHDDGHKEINVLEKGFFLSRMRLNPTSPNIIAVGGKEIDVHLWDLEAPEKPLFAAKNIKMDEVQLRVPVWVTDMTFMQEPNCIAAATRHSHVRLYDTKVQRRPVVNFEFEDSAFTSIAPVPNTSQVVVGTGHGKMLHFDLRMLRPEKALGAFTGYAGAVRDLIVHPEQPVVFSISLDRFLRVHHLKTQKLMFKEYLKSRLNQILIRKDIQASDLFSPEELEAQAQALAQDVKEEFIEPKLDKQAEKRRRQDRRRYFQKRQKRLMRGY